MQPSRAKRTRLVDAARDLAHAKGFSNMTLADVAAAAQVPLGNVYYYFRTKTALGEAIVDALVEHYSSERERWEQEPDAKSRLNAWFDMVERDRSVLAARGCPVGSLCTEFGKTSAELRTRAESVFSSLLDFAEAQFRELGLGAGSRAHDLLVLWGLQGVAVVAHTFHDERLVSHEVTAWRAELETMGVHEPGGE